jgi:zinc D-Ala-D-Ala carboxypeptidase
VKGRTTTAALGAAMVMVMLLAVAFPASDVLAAEPDHPLPVITGDAAVDDAIRSRAEERGYRPRLEVPVRLVAVDGVMLEPEAAAAWVELKQAAAAAGHHLRLIAGYRSPATQRSLFLSRFRGASRTGIDSTLRWTAPPGYSKHHSGRAIDITVQGLRAGRFGTTAAHDWLSDNGARNARIHGFVASYPAGGPSQGPEPEPWEWVFVGRPEAPTPVAGLSRA